MSEEHTEIPQAGRHRSPLAAITRTEQVYTQLRTDILTGRLLPGTKLRFADLNGHLIASRRFKPGEYLNGDLEGMAEMPPQTPIHIALDILDPGPKAVNYSLSFHSPE